MNMSLSVNPVGVFLAAAPAPKKSAEPTYQDVIDGVQKNLDLENFACQFRLEFSREGGAPKIWEADLASWVEGEESKKAAEFTGANQRGTIFLRQGESFYQRNGESPYQFMGKDKTMYGIFKTDYSFKDVLELSRLSADYDKALFERVPEIKVVKNGKEVAEATGDFFHVKLTAKPGNKPFYNQREMWVDAKTLVPRRTIVFGSTGTELKTIDIVETQRYRGINYPKVIVVTPHGQNTQTRIILSDLKPYNESMVPQKYRN
jgi:hypothetical protein